jgi:formylmethanofuran dehydrogenase subunit E
MNEICGLGIDEYCAKVKEFHGGNLAPGLIIAGFMVDLACRNLPQNILFEVICETAGCIPDAVQLLTPCTTGNQWMHVLDVGRYAMSFYDKYSGEGVRVHLNTSKLEKWPAVNEWFFKLKPKDKQDTPEIMKQAIEAGTSILDIEKVTVTPEFLGRRKKESVGICPICNEAFPSDEGTICAACRDGCLPYITETEQIGTV